MQFKIPPNYEGRLLRDFLRRELSVSTKLLARLKADERGILIDGERVTVRHILKAGETLSLLDFALEVPSEIVPVELPISIVYEDEHLLVASKPANMPTHPSHDHYGDTLANALAYYFKDTSEPFVFRPVSRLDRNTSGLVTVAKTKYASSLLNSRMKKGEFRKTYIALLDGTLHEESGRIHTGLRRTADSIIVREVCPTGAEGSDESITEYTVLLEAQGKTLVEVSPLTGRTHQIRLHMAHLGAPILGDDLYGRASEIMPRQALHAISLYFVHPISGASLSLTSPLPDDMARAADMIFGEGTAQKLLQERLGYEKK